VGKKVWPGWARFSLRSALLLLTAGCLGLGLICQRAREQRLAVAALKEVFAEIRYDCDTGPRQTSELPSGVWDANLFHSVVWVALDGPAASDETIGRLRAFPHLRSLTLCEGARVSNDGLKHLEALPRLKHLILASGTADDRGMQHLASRTELEELWIHHVPITDAGLRTLLVLPNLRRVWLSGTGVTEAGIQEFRQQMPACRIDYD